MSLKRFGTHVGLAAVTPEPAEGQAPGTVYLAVAIVCVIKAMRGQRWAVPFLGDLVEKI